MEMLSNLWGIPLGIILLEPEIYLKVSTYSILNLLIYKKNYLLFTNSNKVLVNNAFMSVKGI